MGFSWKSLTDWNLGSMHAFEAWLHNAVRNHVRKWRILGREPLPHQRLSSQSACRPYRLSYVRDASVLSAPFENNPWGRCCCLARRTMLLVSTQWRKPCSTRRWASSKWTEQQKVEEWAAAAPVVVEVVSGSDIQLEAASQDYPSVVSMQTEGTWQRFHLQDNDVSGRLYVQAHSLTLFHSVRDIPIVDVCEGWVARLQAPRRSCSRNLALPSLLWKCLLARRLWRPCPLLCVPMWDTPFCSSSAKKKTTQHHKEDQ